VALPEFITTPGFGVNTWLSRDFGRRRAVVGVWKAFGVCIADEFVSIFIEYGDGSRLVESLPCCCTGPGI